jgi:hypothetical protein
LYDSGSQKTFNQLTKVFCGLNGTSDLGQCALYAKVALNQDDDAGITEYQKGDLFGVATNLTCSQCHYLMINDDRYESVFYATGQTVPSFKQIYDQYDEIGSYIDSNQIAESSPYYHLYKINENDNINEGAVISAFIDLSGFSTTQLITTIPNPEFTISSNSGYGARIRLKTSVFNDSYITLANPFTLMASKPDNRFVDLNGASKNLKTVRNLYPLYIHCAFMLTLFTAIT